MGAAVGIGLAVLRERDIRVEAVKLQSVFVQALLASEQSGLGPLAHRRAEDSILSIMRTAYGKRFVDAAWATAGLDADTDSNERS
jgi:hypothetical protein